MKINKFGSNFNFFDSQLDNWFMVDSQCFIYLHINITQELSILWFNLTQERIIYWFINWLFYLSVQKWKMKNLRYIIWLEATCIPGLVKIIS